IGLCIADRLHVSRHARRHDLVVKRRHEHLDAVVTDDLDAVEQMLLRLERAARPRRSVAGELVDELVDTGSTERDGGATGDESATADLHAITSSETARSARASAARAGDTRRASGS